MSWLWWLNFILLQWLFIRLTTYSYYSVENNYYAYGYKLRVGVLPITGFWNRHIQLPIYIKLYEIKEKRD